MLRLSTRKLLAALTAVLILATAGVAVQGRQQAESNGRRGPTAHASTSPSGASEPVARKAEANRALAREQLALIDSSLEALHQLAQHGRLGLAAPSISVWEGRRLDTLRRAGAGKAEIIAALEKSIEALKQEEIIAKKHHEGARGTQVDVYDVQYRRLEAEIWLNEERAE